jgi:membrane protease subunit (stomatin/prohibitin family)
MALIDVIKHEQPSDDEFVWKYPSEDLSIGAQLIVNEGQEAVFVKGGEVLDIFVPGTHTLVTGNIPILDKLINLPFGGNTPFSAEVWFVNKTVKRNLKWGTPSPVPLFDVSLGFPVNVRSFGKWGTRITDSRPFMTQVVGSQLGTQSEKIYEYFIGEIIQKTVAIIADSIRNSQESILQISSMLNVLSDSVKKSISEEFKRFGLEVINFNVESINIPSEEMEKIQEVFSKTMEARELSKTEVGGAFTAIKSFEILKSAAENPGDGSGVGAMLGAGIGLGAGIPVGQQIGKNIDINEKETASDDPTNRLRTLKEMFDQELITEEQFNSKRDEILRDI